MIPYKLIESCRTFTSGQTFGEETPKKIKIKIVLNSSETWLERTASMGFSKFVCRACNNLIN